MDVVILACMRFAANITFHILLPSISIALGWVLLLFRLKLLRATDPQQKLDRLHAYRLWTKVFALIFALGVVSGVTMSFQFGTNWPGDMERVGNIAGPILIGACVTLPVIVGYTGFSYRVFRGKTIELHYA